MTWTSWAEVEEVEQVEDGWAVVAVANVEDKVQPYKNNPAIKDDNTIKTYEVAGVTSNTEGKILSVIVGLVFESEPKLKAGDLIQVGGHFG